MYVDMGMDPQGSIKDPKRQKKSPNCADDAPVRGARARAPCEASSTQLGSLFSLVAVFYQQETVKSNAKCIIHMV